MKKIKRFFTALLAGLLVLVHGTTALAQTEVNSGSGPASITISNTAQGQTYTLYKLFDATRSDAGISYKLMADKPALTDNEWFETDSAGNVLVKTADTVDITTTEFAEWATSYGKQVGEAVATADTLTFKGLEYGYYFVKSSLGAVITVDSTNPNATVIDKNDLKPKVPDPNTPDLPDTPDPDKGPGGKKVKIASGEYVDISTAQIGDVLDFRIKIVATNHMTENKQTQQIIRYVIEDNPVGLAIKQDSVVVRVDGKVIDTANISFDPSGKMVVGVRWVGENYQSIYKSPTNLTVSYKAVVTTEAKEGQATNNANIKYYGKGDSSNPDNPDDPKNPPIETIPGGGTTINTYKATIKKVNPEKQVIEGAEFRLYDQETGGTEVKVVADGAGAYRVAVEGEDGVVIQGGTAVIKGLKGDKTYWLEEIKAPSGYNILTARKQVLLNNQNGEIEVVNQAGAELPSTGAFGTRVFYTVGSILIVGAAIVLISKRRMKNLD
ncbi:TPA: LPXTG cell wall anchor domain-containing protein [Streptococcus suis]|nr:LPXTG cell wall anchor domain-containing protein [Streptococcus suis]